HGTVVTAAPIGLSSTITTAVSTGALAGGGFASSLFHLMASTKIKSTACAVVFAGLLTPAVMQQRALTAVRQETETLRRATQDFSTPLRQMAVSMEPLNDAGRDELA